MLCSPILENQYYLSYLIGSGKDNRIAQKSCWYDKREQSSFTFEERKNQESPIKHWIPSPITLSGNHFVGVFEAAQVADLKQYLSFKDNMRLLQNKELEAILNDTREVDALLVLYEFF